uniref:Putative secreted protein n=1 Tax=Anopheles darlingi TaxID=43151 RepID=A0A2M4DN48_ANODA
MLYMSLCVASLSITVVQCAICRFDSPSQRLATNYSEDNNTFSKHTLTHTHMHTHKTHRHTKIFARLVTVVVVLVVV